VLESFSSCSSGSTTPCALSTSRVSGCGRQRPLMPCYIVNNYRQPNHQSPIMATGSLGSDYPPVKLGLRHAHNQSERILSRQTSPHILRPRQCCPAPTRPDLGAAYRDKAGIPMYHRKGKGEGGMDMDMDMGTRIRTGHGRSGRGNTAVLGRAIMPLNC
jgi:hypothetical protein